MCSIFSSFIIFSLFFFLGYTYQLFCLNVSYNAARIFVFILKAEYDFFTLDVGSAWN